MHNLPPLAALAGPALHDDGAIASDTGALFGPGDALLPPAGAERIALLVRDGVHREQVERLIRLLDLRGHDAQVLAERLGSVVCSDGSRLPVDASLRRWPAWHFDRVVRLGSVDQHEGRLTGPEAVFMRPASDGSVVPLTCLPWPAASRPVH